MPLRTAADADSVHMGAPPSLKSIRGSDLEQADFRLVWKGEPERKWPPMGEVADALLYVGAAQTLVYPPGDLPGPALPDGASPPRRDIKEYSGQDFPAAIDELVNEATKANK